MENNLKKHRVEKGITQTELAKKSGISRTSINKIENGVTKSVSGETAMKLATVLGISLDEFFSLKR